MAEGQRSEAAYQRVCAELGKVYGEMVAAQETIADLRRQLARQQEQLQAKEADQ